MRGKGHAKSPAEDAQFLFKGTVEKIGARTLAQIPKSEPTAIVRVDEILHAPPALAKTLGKQITVKLAPGHKPKAGEQVLFHANGWLFGDTVAVESVKQEKPGAAKAMLAAPASDPTRTFADRELQNRVSNADMVVEGEVSSVHLPESESFAAKASSDSVRPMSEHDPKWREAVIDVGLTHKGDPATKQVVVRFPSSTDVQWHRAPKFRTGDRGVWLLQSSKAPTAAAKAAVTKGARKAAKAAGAAVATIMMTPAAAGAPVYTALNPMDFQPANKLNAVASVIRTAVAAKNP